MESKAVFEMKDPNGLKYMAYFFSDNARKEIAKSWAGANKGDVLYTGEFRLAIQNENSNYMIVEPEVFENFVYNKSRGNVYLMLIGEIYRSPSRLAKMSFEERRKLVSTFFAGKDTQGRRPGVYLERDNKTEGVKYEIRGAFDQICQGRLTSDGLDLQDFKDISIDYLEDLKAAIKLEEKKSKSSRSSNVLDRPYHVKQGVKQSCHGKDLRIEPQDEQWVAWGNIHLIDLTSSHLNNHKPLPHTCQVRERKSDVESREIGLFFKTLGGNE